MMNSGSGLEMGLRGVAVSMCILCIHLVTEAQILDKRMENAKVSREYKSQIQKNVLIDDRQASAFFLKNQRQDFYYLRQKDVNYLSITVTPCTPKIEWSIRFVNTSGQSKVTFAAGGIILWDSKGTEGLTHTIRDARGGLYLVQVSNLERAGKVDIFVTTMPPPGHPGLLRKAKISVNNLRPRGEVALHWPPSLLDPYLMKYWLVVNKHHPYPSLCLAQSDKDGVDIPNVVQGDQSQKPLYPDIIVIEAGNETSSVVRGLVGGERYYFEVFGVNTKTNLSFLHGRLLATYQPRVKPNSLLDSQPVTFNIRGSEGRVTFRYKVKKKWAGRKLEWYVMPCGGGSLEAEVRHRGTTLIKRQRVEGYAVLRLDQPIPGAKYILRLIVSDPEQLAIIKSVEVMASMRGLNLPDMPTDMSIHEYTSLRTCRSVTVGWLPIQNLIPNEDVTYCIRAREVHKSFSYKWDQCRLEDMLNTLDYQVQCQDIRPSYNNKSVITEHVTDLKPGRTYELQVTVKKPKTKMLSYHILHVHTKPTCS